MSKNLHTKQQLRTKPGQQTLKKASSSSSPNDPKKLSGKPTTTTTKVSSLSKEDEKKKLLSNKKAVQTIPVKRVSNGGTTKQSMAKPSVSRSRESSIITTPRFKPPVVSEKSTTPSKTTPSKTTPSKTRQSSSVRPKESPVSRPPSSKPNVVMNSIHNVTVSSPPSKRKELPIEPIIEQEEPRLRTKRNKIPEESAIIKSNVINPRKQETPPNVEVPVTIKEPIAFEVTFDDGKLPIPKDKLKKNESPSVESDSGPDYDDDFESYESDFETGSSSEVVSESTSPSISSSTDDRESPPNESETDTEQKTDDEEESELTHIPVTVIHREKEQERKLDSGHYDLNSKKRRPVESFDSLDTLANSEQLDSGISYENSVSATIFEEPGSVAYGGYAWFHVQPRITKRGVEIMSKIQFDMISFTLLDLKPIPYEIFMRMYGSSNTMQSATQTFEDRLESECQTEDTELRSVWTQHPPQYDLVTIKGSSGISRCTGEFLNNVNENTPSFNDLFDKTIRGLSKLRQDSPLSDKVQSSLRKPINFERLNAFLHSSSSIISRILFSNGTDQRLETTDLPKQSKGYFKLNTSFLNALKVVRVFANAKFSLILTVHESIANVYQSDFSNLIMVWNNCDSRKPVRLLSTWSEVSRAEICNDSSDIIVCGLRDGSIAMWDLRETYSFCSKLDGHLTHFAATHSIAPSWGGAELRSFDLGAVVDVKSFRSTAKGISNSETFRTIQFASLNETGILAIWTLIDTGARNYETSQRIDSKFEYSSPWARVKLTQSAICDLREYIELGAVRPKSAFERTKSNFQKDVFNDDILKELAEINNETKLGYHGLRFINLDCGTELLFVGTNRNVIISCSKTLKRERFRKINIIGSGFLFPTAVKLLQNEDFLAVGLSNGSVMILNCNQEKSLNNPRNSELVRPPGTTQSMPKDTDYEIGKSCAIQNIIRNERMPPESRFVEHEFRPDTAALISATLGDGKKPYELRVFDEQILLNGSVLRKDLVQNLEVSSDGWMLFALSDGNVRTYDFFTESEASFNGSTSSRRSIAEIAVIRGDGDERNVIFLDSNNEVQVHLLK